MQAPDTPKSSTSQIKTSKFHPHGIVDIWMEGRLMHYECTGPFNSELVECFAIAQRDFLLANRPEGEWISVCTMISSAMTSPDGIARYAQIMATPKPEGLTPMATAFVIASDVEGGRFMAPLYRQIYDDIGRPFQVFETMVEAQTWTYTMLEPSDAA